MVSMKSPDQPALPALPNAPPPPPVFAQSPTGSKPKQKSATPSFINASALPSPSATGGGKQLVGE